MGIQQGGNGGNVPSDGDRSPDDPQPASPNPPDLPELPPEWGEITIPDDPSELAAEAEQVRRELAERRAPARHPGPELVPGRDTEPSIGVPLLIMSVAVLITLVSLFAMAWSGSGGTDRAGTGTGTGSVESLPAITLTNGMGGQVPVAGYAPVAILLIEACEDCGNLVAETAATAPPGVTVVAVGRDVPSRPPDLDASAQPLLLLADPNQVLRTELGLGAPVNAATVVLVDQDRRITRTVPAATAAGQFQADLTELAPG